MKLVLLGLCISSVYILNCSYKVVLEESLREREVTLHMMQERSKVIHRRMVIMQPYINQESVSLVLLSEYMRLKADRDIMDLIMPTLGK